METHFAVFSLTIFTLFAWARGSVVQPQINGANSALIYLSRFGYLNPSATNGQSSSLVHKEVVSRAIMEFQAFAGLNQTGLLDEETSKMMNTPRCGVVDKVGFGVNARRKKRYALQGSRWKVNDLTYKITKYPYLLTRAEVDRDISKAFKVWSDITQLTFTPVTSGKVHIEIRFEKNEHGDGDPFDGPGGTLAHAYFPVYGGDAHFDDSETWTVNSYRGTNLFQVAAHEFGHSLGLSHTDVSSALMAPFYRGYQSRFKIDNDDITAIQQLYGAKKPKDRNPVPAVPNRPTKPGKGGVLCSDGSFDAIVTLSDEMTYVFKDKNVFQLTDTGVARHYPKRISSEFDGLPSDLDASFTWTNGKTYFFKGSKYWRSEGLSLDEGYPKEISKGFSGIPNNVDAAFVWSGNGKIYFFKGTNYYKFDIAQKPPVSPKYPKDIALWEGLPYYIDDALQYTNGYTYFFKNGKYWRFNDRNFQVDKGNPSYPRLVGSYWFGCPTKGNQVPAPSDDNSNNNNNSLSFPGANPNAIPDTRSDSSDDTFYSEYYDDSDSYPDYHVKYGQSQSLGAAAGASGSHVTGASSLHFAWLVIPLLLRLVCL